MSGSFWQHRSVFLTGLAIVACVRIGALGLGWESLGADPDAYRALAATWRDTGTLGRVDGEGHPVPSAYRPPLYPWVLSWFPVSETGESDRAWIAALHGVLGIATCFVTFQIGKQLGLSAWACVFAMVWVACDPILIRQSTLVMTETLATFLGAILWWCWLRDSEKFVRDRWDWRSLLLGLGMGLAVLCRPTALAWLVLWWGVALLQGRYRSVMMSALGVAALVVPWTVRNAIQFGTPVATTTHGGYTLYLANNPILYRHWSTSMSRQWDEDAFHAQWRVERSQSVGQDEIRQDRFAQSLAWSTIASDPRTFALGCAIRAGWLWALWPAPRQASPRIQVAIACWYSLAMGLAVLGGIRGIRTKEAFYRWLPGLLLVVSLTLVHSVYWSNMRMRAPAIPVVSLMAALGVCRLVLGYRRGVSQREDC
ncbi:MAG: phospholipid carrier-dependent glycosyltransferase [Planctomycetota bacterium]|jgi:hypothetical protein